MLIAKINVSCMCSTKQLIIFIVTPLFREYHVVFSLSARELEELQVQGRKYASNWT